MRGRRPGRPTKWVNVSVEEWLPVDRAGFHFTVWEKWKRRRKKLGTLVVSVGGVRWKPASGKYHRRHSWQRVADWLSQ